MLLVLTHIDQLRPFNEWQPPYDLAAGDARQGRNRSAAPWRRPAAELGFAADEIVPVRADIAVAPYNIDALWAKIIELVPEAQRARLLRTLGDIKSASGWGAVWSQAANAGRVIKGTFLTRSTRHDADQKQAEERHPAGEGREAGARAGERVPSGRRRDAQAEPRRCTPPTMPGCARARSR